MKTHKMIWMVWLAALGFGPQLRAECQGHATLNDYERKSFVAAAYGPDATVALQFLATKGCNMQMLESLKKIGAKVDYSDAKVGYVFVSLPKNRVLEALDVRGMAYASVPRVYKNEQLIPLAERKIVAVPRFTIPIPRVAKTLPPDGPYFANEESGVTALWKEHPSADGRGVRVAVADEGFDLLHPELQKGRDARGQLVPKISDIDILASVETDDSWVQFGEAIKSEHGVIRAADVEWHVPSQGEYRFGIYDHHLSLGREVDAQHPVTKLELSAGVLWDEKKGLVWVDTNGDHDFRNDTPQSDYRLHQEIAWFGTKEGDDDNRIPFAVKVDASRKAVNISIGGSHGAYIGGALAGNKLTGGLFDGTAPSAQLVDVRLGNGKIPFLLRAFARNDVDIVNRSGGLARDTPAEEFEGHVLERALAVYRKPLACSCDLSGALNIEDYQSGETLRRNRQMGPPYLEAMNSGLSFSEDGLVNAVLAPSQSLLAQSRYLGSVPWADGKRHVSDEEYDPLAPDGYAIGSNPSPTIVVVSGVLADLISEARRQHVRYDYMRLTNAIFTSSKQVSGFPASQQGYGLINAAAAWKQLTRMAKADDPSNANLTSFKIFRSVDGAQKEIHGFHADLPKAGENLNAELWIKRIGGYAGSRTYRLALRANDGTYSLEDHEANFVREVGTRVRFRANVAPGFHVAFLQLIDKKSDTVMQEVPLSMRAPEVPEVLAPGIEKYQATIPPLHKDFRWVRVEDTVQAVRYHMQLPWGGPPSFVSGCSFPGHRCSGTKPQPGEPVDAAHHVGPLQEYSSLVANKEPGNQTVFWENYGRADYGTAYYGLAPDVPIQGTLTVTKFAVEIVKVDGETLRITNKLADIEGKVELYDAKASSQQVLGDGKHASADLLRTLPAQLTQWRVSVSADGLAAGSADAFLLNCTNHEDGCLVTNQALLTADGATLVADKPKPGDWRIVIRSRNTAAKNILYHVSEQSLIPEENPVEEGNQKHSSGSNWSLPLPPKKSDARYAAFRIAGAPGSEREQDGLRIALTLLDIHD